MRIVKRGKIQAIYFPNNAGLAHQSAFVTNSKISDRCDEIIEIEKHGEAAMVKWLQVLKDNQVVAEIKESICDIYFHKEPPC